MGGLPIVEKGPSFHLADRAGQGAGARAKAGLKGTTAAGDQCEFFVIEGLENIDRSRPQMFVANHSGLHDILSLAAHLPIQFRWIAKKSLFQVPFMGWHMLRSGYIAIDRENPRDASRSIVEAAKTIHDGINAIAFPEGTRSRTGELGRFHSGAFS
ncbi:MAG: lysophospholipid acyltransferase family protein, partial [Acidobacteriota bacterium]